MKRLYTISLLAIALSCQAASAGNGDAPGAEEEEILELSPFELRRDWTSPVLETPPSAAQTYDELWIESRASSFILSGKDIDDLDIRRIGDVGLRLPALSYSPAGAAGFDILSMRGASAGAAPPEYSDSVAFFLNSTQLERVPKIVFEPHDIERIELVTGPSGVMHGKNAMGGVVNLVLRKPDLRKSFGHARISAGASDYLLSGYYSAALTPDLTGLVVSASVRSQDRLFNSGESPTTPNQLNAQVRAQFLYQSGGHRLDTTLLVGLDSRRQLGLAGVNAGRAISAEDLDGLTLDAQVDLFFDNLHQVEHLETSDVNAILNAEYRRTFSKRLSFEYFTSIHITNGVYGTGVVQNQLGSGTQQGSRETEYLLQEFRMHFNFPRWRSTVGLRALVDRTFDIDEAALNMSPFDLAYNISVETDELAAYAQSEYKHKDFYVQFGSRFTTVGSILGTGFNDSSTDFFPSKSGSNDRRSVTAELAVGYLVRQRHHFILKYERLFVGEPSIGLSSGPSINFVGGAVPRASQLRQEHSSHFEFVYKAELSARSRLSLSLYHIDYDDKTLASLDVESFLGDGWLDYGFLRSHTQTRARAQGLETRWQYRHSLYFSVDVGASLSNSRYLEPLASIAPGTQIAYTPPYRHNLRFSGEAPFGNGYSFNWLVDIRGSGRVVYDTTGAFSSASSYHIIDTHLRWRMPRGWLLSLWLRNLGDSQWTENAYLVAGHYLEIRGIGREVQLRVEYQF